MSDLVWSTETPIGPTSWSKALARHGAGAQVALAEFLRVAAREILMRDRLD
jgi:hypothetical protein